MEIRQQQELTRVMGALEMVLSLSMLSSSSSSSIATSNQEPTSSTQEDTIESRAT
jgi:hypothetical protein